MRLLSHRRPARAQASLRSLARIFAVHTHKGWKQTKGPTKNQTSSPTGRMSYGKGKVHVPLSHGWFIHEKMPKFEN